MGKVGFEGTSPRGGSKTVTQHEEECVLTMQGLSSEGDGVARAQDGKVVFVEGALTGETCQVHRHYCQQNFDRGTLLEIISPSPHRIEPLCPHYSECGGCQIQHLAYSEQLVFKRDRIQQALRRIGGINEISIEPVISSPQWEYRNKLSLTIDGRNGDPVMGMRKSKSVETIEISDCLIASPVIRNAILPLKDFREQLAPFYEKVFLRTFGEDLVLVFETSETISDLDAATRAAEHSAAVLGARGFCLSTRSSGSALPRVLGAHGTDFYKVPMGSVYSFSGHTNFLQVNNAIAESLYRAVCDISTPETNLAVDAYCGVGILTLMLSQRFDKVIGLEMEYSAIRHAISAAAEQGITNVSFYDEPLPRGLTKEKYAGIIPDLIVLDPPRGGCDEETLRRVSRSGAHTVAMISCHPATLARDLARLRDFRIILVQPFDMFPQTYHTECLVVLVRQRDSAPKRRLSA